MTPGDQLGAYRIVEALGAGGMGEVYRARDSHLEREVALKVLSSSVTESPERLRRLEREAKALAALNHPNIVTVHSVEEADGVRFLTMELVEGETGSSWPRFTRWRVGEQRGGVIAILEEREQQLGLPAPHDLFQELSAYPSLEDRPEFRAIRARSRESVRQVLKILAEAERQGKLPAYLEDPMVEVRRELDRLLARSRGGPVRSTALRRSAALPAVRSAGRAPKWERRTSGSYRSPR